MVGAAGPNANLGSLAYQHEDVTILFMVRMGLFIVINSHQVLQQKQVEAIM